MNKLTLVLGCLTFAIAANGAEPATGNRFAAQLYGLLAAEQPGNLVVSPFSIHAALAMVAGGAGGETEAQMLEVLSLPADRIERAAALRAHLDRIEAIGAAGDVTLESANRVWVQQGFPLLQGFTRDTEAIFGAGFAPADFVQAAEATRSEINQWVEAQTRERIQNLIPQGMLTPLTRMVLANAVYFFGKWETPFSKDRTVELPFHVSAAQSRSVPMMRASLEHTGYREEKELQVCELLYQGRDVGMIVLLPAAGGLDELEARVASEGLDAVIGNLDRKRVEVTLPRFKIEAALGLNKLLMKLGMTDAFTEARADFSRMTGTRDLHISAVVHKAFIEVNEEGTEAAAATGVSAMPTSVRLPEQPVVFRADRPFLFVLRDRTTGTVLFLGRVADPGD